MLTVVYGPYLQNISKYYPTVTFFRDELTVKTFDFAMKARDKFENGDLYDKKLVVRAVGSNLLLKDKKLEIQPRNLFIIVKEGADRLKELNERLEPKKKTVYMDKSEVQKEISSCWRALRNDVRTYWCDVANVELKTHIMMGEYK